MPTRAEYVAFLRKHEGGYGPARGLRNNDNDFNTWYYGRRVSGDVYAWCEVFECWGQNHFDILAKNGGKGAYVPEMKARAHRAGAKVVTRPGSTHGMKPGDALCYDFNRNGSPEHTGTFVRATGPFTLLAVEANTETSRYSDAVALRERNVADVLWHIELLGVTDHQEEDMPLTNDDVQKLLHTAVDRHGVTVGEGLEAAWDTKRSLAELAHKLDALAAQVAALKGGA